MTKIVALAGRNSSKSINKKLLEAIVSWVENAEVELLDLATSKLPFPELTWSESEFPESMSRLKGIMDSADLSVM